MAPRKLHLAVVDDDFDIRTSLSRFLEGYGFRVSTAAGGSELEVLLQKTRFDLIVLDIMMPGADGLEICKRIQETHATPVIFLTALADDIDRIIGLELGADDYLTKPFNPRELLARIRSVVRRAEMLPPSKHQRRGKVRFANWVLDFSKKELIGPDQVVVRLSSGEHLLLLCLIEHAGVTLSRDQLLDLTKGREAQLFDRSIDNVISRLRRKIEPDSKNPQIIVTEWGNGYAFVADLEPV